MAIDSTLFAASVPAGTYAAGDRVNLAVIRGPAIVRDGYGEAILKRIATFATSGNLPISIHVKNSDWNDDMANISLDITNDTALSKDSASTQSGQNCRLVKNSGWEVYGVVMAATTTTAAIDFFTLIDVDYPSVASVQNPQNVEGFPVTVEYLNNFPTVINAIGNVAAATWSTLNVDVFKAGSKYLLTQAGFRNGASCGFMSISRAAGQAGLERIIPVKPGITGMKYLLDYSTPLVKGPMDLNLLSFASSGSTANAYVYLDFVKKKL